MNALMKYLQCHAFANMNSRANIFQANAFPVMLLNVLHHDLEAGLICAVGLLLNRITLKPPMVIQFIPKPKQGFYLMKKKCEQDIIQNATGRT